MKNLYTFLIALLSVAGVNAQCVIDTTALASSTLGGAYPSPAHLAHAVRDSLYDQTVQGKIPGTISQSLAGFSATIRIDSVRLDTIYGLPNGITWVKNPAILHGNGYGCVEFMGSANDTAGAYALTAVGMTWVHLTVPILSLDKDTFQYGSLNRLPQFNNYYIVVDSAQLPLTATVAARNLCYGDTAGSATVTAAGGSPTSPYTYAWSNSGTSYRVTPIPAGTYSVTVTSGTETATASVSIATEPTPMVVVTSTDSGSTGIPTGTATVTVSGGVPPYTYNWNPGNATGDSLDSLPAGTYRVTVIDSFGCRATDTAVIQDLCASFVLVTTDSGSTGANGSAVVAVTGGYPPYTYSWSNGSTTSGISGLAPGSYKVTVSDSKGCVKNKTATVQNLLGIAQTNENAPHISLFPNPANTSMNVVITSKQAVTGRAEVIDMTGRVVYSAPLTVNGQYNFSLNVTEFSAGLYTLQISAGAQSANQRFEVAH